MRERYHRPPLVGPEARSELFAVWRFRLLLLLLLVLIAAVMVLLIHLATGGAEGNPGLGGGATLGAHPAGATALR